MVTGEQMRLLFAEGRHPLAEIHRRWGAGAGCAVPAVDRGAAVPGGAAGPVRRPQHRAGPPRHAALPAEVRARLRGELAAEWFPAAGGA